MKNIFSIAICFFLVLSFACSKKKSTNNTEVLSIEDTLVDNNEITGWSYAGAGWTANNISELTTKINGMAEIFQRHGFVEAAHRKYQGTIDNGTRNLRLTVYNMGSESNAKDTYDDPDFGLSGATNWSGGAGKEAHYVRYGGFSQVLTFYRNSYFVYLEMKYDTEESLSILQQFALNVDGKVQ